MSYQALYRVWRPQSFDELVGQKMIAETLANAVNHQQLSHAYLFTGPRGTGKTSAAKILSKAVNCLNPQNGNPCNECEVCKAITQGQAADVIEIDAASNNGVEEIRDIRDKVRYAPTIAKYKVYIIDEVHMLTTGAFNALLKTLEEPPSHVIFILATTEPHKIPATIISRTQRFDFQRIHNQDLIARMEHILNHNQVNYEIEALEIIARTANGGMRDSLSLLDQALSYREDLTIESALQVSGSISHQEYVRYIEDVFVGEGYDALKIVQEASQKGKQASRFIEELILFARDILLSAHTKQNYTLLPNEELTDLLAKVDVNFYFKMIDQLNQAQNQMRFSNQPDLYLEVITVQLAQNAEIKSDEGTHSEAFIKLNNKIIALEEKINVLEQQLKQTPSPTPQPNRFEAPRVRPQIAQQEYQQMTEKIYDVLDQATRAHITRLKQEWPMILSMIAPQERVKFNGTVPLAAGPGVALISFSNIAFCGLVQHDQALEQQLINVAEKRLGESMVFVYIIESEWRTVRNDYKILREKNGGKPLREHSMNSEPTSKIKSKSVEHLQADSDNQSSLENVGQNDPVTMSRYEQEKPMRVDYYLDQMDEESQPLTQDELDQREAELGEPAVSIQDAFKQKRLSETKSNEENVAKDGAESQIPDSVTQAIQIFGEDNINIYYDK